MNTHHPPIIYPFTLFFRPFIEYFCIDMGRYLTLP